MPRGDHDPTKILRIQRMYGVYTVPLMCHIALPQALMTAYKSESIASPCQQRQHQHHPAEHLHDGVNSTAGNRAIGEPSSLTSSLARSTYVQHECNIRLAAHDGRTCSRRESSEDCSECALSFVPLHQTCASRLGRLARHRHLPPVRWYQLGIACLSCWRCPQEREINFSSQTHRA